MIYSKKPIEWTPRNRFDLAIEVFVDSIVNLITSTLAIITIGVPVYFLGFSLLFLVMPFIAVLLIGEYKIVKRARIAYRNLKLSLSTRSVSEAVN